jgi:EAL domain-containing protein (putative c-di-GMP-specific phosphodiesterase class I)
VALEALLRWDHPEHGPIPPSDFIPVAEETGLIEQLGDWVVRAVCEQQADWAARGLLPLISFNVAPRQLRRLDFTARIVEHLRATGADPTRLIVELTSSSLQEAADPAPILQELRALGLGLALDDFGAGSSSLAALRTLPFSALRIHRDLLRGVPEDPEAAELVSAVLRITNALGRDAVVEGVESEAQLAFLAAAGCPYAQGFLFSEPLPPEAAAALVEAVAAPAAR